MGDDGFRLEVQEAIDERRMLAHEVGRTPTPVVEQRARLLVDRWQAPRILDPSAGSGVFGMVLRQLFPRAHIVAVEPRAEERTHLERHCDEVQIAYFEDALAGLRECEPFDLIATNPPFSLMRPRFADPAKGITARESWLDPLRWLQRDRASSLLLLLLRADAFWRKPADARWFAQSDARGASRKPSIEHKIPGRIAFYGDANTANETHSWMGWGHPLIGAPPSWPTSILPMLEPHELRWQTPPGQER